LFEFYLFVNPLGEICLEAEQKLLEALENRTGNLHFRFIPVVNMKSIEYSLLRKYGEKPSIEERNRAFENSYSAALDLKAIQHQGRKKGREFIMAIQKAVAVEKKHYSRELVIQIVKSINADVEMFLEDRQSDLVKRSFVNDQQIAREMCVRLLPSAVVFDMSIDEDGLIIEDGLLDVIEAFGKNQVKSLEGLTKIVENAVNRHYNEHNASSNPFPELRLIK